MNECCSSCRYMLKLEKFDYSQGGCKHTAMDGYACTVFEREGRVAWMVGMDECGAICEVYEPERNGDE